MKTIEEKLNRFDNRDEWAPGPWDSEPDKRQWMSQSGLPCLIVRSQFGGLCGYVGVPYWHPWFRKGYHDVDADVHWGLTFSDHCHEGGYICHKVEPGEDDNVWWLGFDCGHCADLQPGLHATIRKCSGGILSEQHDYEVYRDFAYVTAECESLAKQANAAFVAVPEWMKPVIYARHWCARVAQNVKWAVRRKIRSWRKR